MPEMGYALSSEEHGPDELIGNAASAEAAGFEHALISDHFHPWVPRQGHSPFVWSTLGAIARETESLRVGTDVTCPTTRIHPVNVAHAAATVAEMFDGRFFFGVGTGENLNEHVTGERWPEFDVRMEMLEEAIDVIRKLWTGENVSHHGKHYTVENAKLFTVPDEQPPVYVSGTGPTAARKAGERGDGLISTAPVDEFVEAFEEAGDGPRYGQMTVCYARDEQEAEETAARYWPNTAIPGELSWELPTPKHFEAAAEMLDDEAITQEVVTGADPDDHVEKVQEFTDAGFDHVYVHQIGPEQDEFMEFYESEVLPSVG